MLQTRDGVCAARMPRNKPQPRTDPSTINLSNLSINVLGNTDLQEIIVRYYNGIPVFYLRSVAKTIKDSFKSPDLTYLNPCPGKQKDCDNTTNHVLDLDCTSHQSFVKSFRKTCKESPTSACSEFSHPDGLHQPSSSFVMDRSDSHD